MSTNAQKQNPFQKDFNDLAQKLERVELIQRQLLEHANENQKNGRS